MNNKDLNISGLKEMQFALYEKNKERWNDMNPEASKNHILYMVEEIGECISIIKKKGIESIMEKESQVRGRFLEEYTDVLMYYTEVLNRLDVSSEELSKAYVDKYESNMNRNYKADNEKKYND